MCPVRAWDKFDIAVHGYNMGQQMYLQIRLQIHLLTYLQMCLQTSADTYIYICIHMQNSIADEMIWATGGPHHLSY